MGMVMGIVGAAVSVASSLKKSKEASNQAEADKKAQQAAWIQRLADTRENYKQVAQQAQQVNQEYRQDLMQNQVSLAQQKADVELMAAATGTGGNSVSSMLTDLSASAGQNQARIIQNYENEQQSISNQLRQVQTGGAMEMRTFNKPSSGSTILGAANAGLSGYMSGSKTGTALQKAYTDSRRGSNIKMN
ncbi:MAG: virion core protein, T7 gp14 family [Enterobacterales bacterium]